MSIKSAIKKVVVNCPGFKIIYQKRSAKKQEAIIKKRVETINSKGSYVVREIETILTDADVEYFATCGTLLGFIREGRLLRNDYDMDYAVVIENKETWDKVESCLNKHGYSKIRFFSLGNRVTEHTYKNIDGVEIDIFGHFIDDNVLCFYSYDKLENVSYRSEDEWSAYILENGRYEGTKKIILEIGEVTVPKNAEEYLAYNYNDDWRIPNPDFRPNTGKGCRMLEGEYGNITVVE